jgi:hypothetical protein
MRVAVVKLPKGLMEYLIQQIKSDAGIRLSALGAHNSDPESFLSQQEASYYALFAYLFGIVDTKFYNTISTLVLSGPVG